VTASRIQQLPNNVVTKIAAGEVIERPASVVKELLENSLDAGATRIDIDIEHGGTELIRVVDNGRGIHSDDLELAFSNHATSKLSNADDLFAVRTMGFRGEALASIGGVAQVTLQSRPAGAESGAEISNHGGEMSPIRAWNGSPGTRIEVRHLFFNTPVRRKFLRSVGTEVGHVCEIFTRIALSRPNLHLTLKHNGKSVYEVAGSSSLLERIGLFFGKDVRDQLYPVDAMQGPAHLFGFIGDPACDRGNAKLQYLFLNNRWIRDRSLGHAISEGYRGLLMTGRYPVTFLYLDLPPDHVDVNVHPTKSEVRFRDASALYSFFLGSVRTRLGEEKLIARLQPPSNPAMGGAAPFTLQPRPLEASPSLFGQAGFPTFTRNPATPLAPTMRFAPPTIDEAPPINDEPPPMPAPPPAMMDEAPTLDEAVPAPIPSPSPSPAPIEQALQAEPVNAIQLHNAYLVVETPEGMLVIDQHALHERILFEQIKVRVQAGSLEVQQLLIPEPVELTAEQAALLLDRQKELSELGLGIEDFGGNTVLVTRYPAIMGKRSPAAILKRVVDHLSLKDRLPTREILLNDLMSLMACHAAVRAGDALSSEEIEALLAMRHLASDVHHCPHGRPTALLFTRHDLDRQFGRV
jgi:DNA mismatch repair protein MutL